MHKVKTALIVSALLLMSGCSAIPFGIGLIPGAPSYVSSLIGGGQSAYETAVDERSTEQQMLDAVIAGHAQAELYKHKEIRPNQITAYCYFNRLYLVGEYDSQEQLREIYECMEKVKDKRGMVSRLYLKSNEEDMDFFTEQAKYAELRTQLMADFDVTSSPIEVKIVQGDIILLGVIAEKEERDRVMAHALSMDGINRVISYLSHKECGGPEPRIMTAQLPPAKQRTASYTKKRKRHVRTKATRTIQPAEPVLVVSNPDRGR